MNNKRSIFIYFSVVVLLVVLTYGLKSTYAYFVANERGVATNIKVAKLVYYITSDDLENNKVTLKPYEVKKVNFKLSSDYDFETVYRVYYEGNVTAYLLESSTDKVKDNIGAKETKDITIVLANNTDTNQEVGIYANGGYVGNELEDSNIDKIFDESLLMNKVLISNNLTYTVEGLRDLDGTNNYVSIDDVIYRIIGVFNDKDDRLIKLVANDSIGKQLFGENNNYITSSLKEYLNVDYKESLPSNITKYLKEVTYYTAGLDKVLEEDNYLTYERGETVANEEFNASGLSTIGLMYLSDYVYANKWINKDYAELTIVPNVSDINKVFCINYNSETKANTINGDCLTTNEYDVRPVMYLDNKLVALSGTGTESDPYIIK